MNNTRKRNNAAVPKVGFMKPVPKRTLTERACGTRRVLSAVHGFMGRFQLAVNPQGSAHSTLGGRVSAARTPPQCVVLTAHVADDCREAQRQCVHACAWQYAECGVVAHPSAPCCMRLVLVVLLGCGGRARGVHVRGRQPSHQSGGREKGRPAWGGVRRRRLDFGYMKGGSMALTQGVLLHGI